MSQWAWWVGIDLGSIRHEVCILDGRGRVTKRFAVDHDPRGLARLVAEIQAVSGGQFETVTAALETPHGLVCEVLVERAVAVHAINPKQLDRFRDRYNVAGAKDDALDARVLADSLRTDTRLYRRVAPLPEVNLRLRELSRALAEVEGTFRQQANRLWSLLCRYCPALLKFCPGADEPWLWALLQAAGTPATLAALTERRLATLLRPYRIRRFSPAELAAVLQAGGLAGDPRVAQLCRERVRLLLAQLRLLHRQLGDLQKMIGRILAPALRTQTEGTRPVAAATPRRARANRTPAPATAPAGEPGCAPAADPPLTDMDIVLSMVGIGWKTGAILLGEAAPSIRQADYRSLRGESGTAPVTQRSGKSTLTLMRRACNYRLRDALHHAAGVAIQHVEPWKKIYHRIRSQGGSHARAVRQIADKMLKVLCVMLRERTLFDIHRLNRLVVTG